MAKQPLHRIECPYTDCSEFRLVLVHEEAVSRLLGLNRNASGDKGWLDDEGVNGILLKMLCNLQKDGRHCDAYLFSSFFYERLKCSFQYALEVARKNKAHILNKRKWLIPMCTMCHWHAAVVDTERLSITMFDSLHIRQQGAAQKIRDFATHFYPNSKWDIYFDTETIPMQPNGHDCGVFMIKAIEKVLLSLESTIDAMKGPIYREQFLTLLSSSYKGDGHATYSSIKMENESSTANSSSEKDKSVSNPSCIHTETSTANPSSINRDIGTTNSSSEKDRTNANRYPSPINTETSTANPSSEKDHSVANDSCVNRDNSIVQVNPRKPLKLSLPKKRHSYQECDYPGKVDYTNNSQTSLQTSFSVCSTHAGSPQDIRSTQPQQLTSSQYLKDITNITNHIKDKQQDDTQTTCPLPKSDHDAIATMNLNSLLSWKQLAAPLQTVLPSNSKYTYVIEQFKPKSNEEFGGAPVHCFEAVIRINLSSEEEAKQWVQDMMAHSLTTYRTTRTTNPGLKRVRCKLEMHCQHYRKPLSKKQKQASATVQSKKSKCPITYLNRDKKTQCPANLTLAVQIPTKKQHHTSEKYPYLLTHTGLLKLSFTHNHPLTSAHTLSFRDVTEETKQAFFDLFSVGHSAATAKHTYEQQLMNSAETEAEMQTSLADRSMNPLVQDTYRLFRKWQESTYGKDDGLELFEKLQERVDEYNKRFALQGGKAKLQRYEADIEYPSDNDEDHAEDDMKAPKKKKPKITRETPFILSLCTPLMARVHVTVCQAGEITFCDCTSSLDRFNTALSVLSTTHCASGMPLGIILSSDERETTLAKGLEMLKSIVPENAFFGRGASTGPKVIMTDDSSTERAALQKSWPSTRLLLCTFHFLQRRWTWLWEGKNKIRKEDRKLLIDQVKDMVYAQSEALFLESYSSLKSHDVTKNYPHFIKHVDSLMDKAKDWAHCHRRCLIIRGNHTNNYAEAGIKILKELVFSRIKAYNMVQMFHFVVDIMDNYYQRKLLSIANNRLETYIALRFKGVNTKKIGSEDIQKGKDNWYRVRSQSDKLTWYDVNPTIGVCTCTQGRDGSPCSHQAGIVYNLGEESLNYICTLSAQARLQIAQLAVGDKAISNASFYASLHQRELEERYTQAKQNVSKSINQPDFTGTEWDLIRSGADDVPATCDHCDTDHEYMSKMIDNMAEDMKSSLLRNDPQLSSGIDKFISRYFNLSNRKSYALLASALHGFGKQSTGVVHASHLRHGPRIPIQATAAGRRRRGVSRGKGKVPAGRPVKRLSDSKAKTVITRYFLPTRKEPKGKRPHNLSFTISRGLQNAGKW